MGVYESPSLGKIRKSPHGGRTKFSWSRAYKVFRSGSHKIPSVGSTRNSSRSRHTSVLRLGAYEMITYHLLCFLKPAYYHNPSHCLPSPPPRILNPRRRYDGIRRRTRRKPEMRVTTGVDSKKHVQGVLDTVVNVCELPESKRETPLIRIEEGGIDQCWDS